MSDIEHVRERYRRFADNECRGYSDHYYKLARAVADDDWLCGFIAQMPVIQPNLFLALLQFLTGPQDMPRSAEQARALVQENVAAVTRLMHSRRTQTNEVGRCATLLPALPRRRLALVEVGASAGLCLLLDKFAYDYGGVHLGPEASPVLLQCTVTGQPPLPDAVPQIDWRAGLDLNPLDVHDDDDAKWLLSCVWPDHFERRERLAAAIKLARAHELSLRRGNLVSELPDLLAEAPRDAELVVFHSAVLVYVSAADRRTFANVLAEASRQRDIVWISNEAPTVVPEITALAPPVEPPRFLLGRTRFRDGHREDELLAVAHAHGADLQWVWP